MALFIQTDATGAGAGTIDPNIGAANLIVIADGDTGLGVDPPVGNRQLVTYVPTLTGAPPVRLDAFVNTAFSPDYGSGPQNVDTIILPVLDNFVFNDNSTILSRGGTALPPQGSGLPGAGLNTTGDCLVIYDTTQNQGSGWCMARAGTGGTIDLQTPNAVILYHELSHAFRIVNNNALALTGICNPSSPEENAAITEENDLRTQIANRNGTTPELRDPGIHCGGACGPGTTPPNCCIIASVASGSQLSATVQELRQFRDDFLRRTEVGFAFFQSLFHDYYDFSPQVCTIMAQDPALPPVVFHGYVEPLLIMFRTLASVPEAHHDEDIGKFFLTQAGTEERRAASLAAVQQALHLWQGGDFPDTAIAARLKELLRDRAMPSEHVGWALVEPLKIYADALEVARKGDAAQVGQTIREAAERWGAEFPIDAIWASLSSRKLEEEMGHVDRLLLTSEAARARFRARLRDRYGHLRAIRDVTSKPPTAGGGL